MPEEQENIVPDHNHTLDKIEHGDLLGLGKDQHTGYILADGTRAFTGEQSMGTKKLTNVVDPTADQDAATKKYVDDQVKETIFEISTAFEDIARFTTFDEAGAGVGVGGLNLNTPSASRTRGVEIENKTAFKVFGNGNTVEFTVLVEIAGGASQRNHFGYIVVGDLTGAAAPTMTNNHFGFKWSIINDDGIGLEGTQADGTNQILSNSIDTGVNSLVLRAVYNGSNVKYYKNGTLIDTVSVRMPAIDAAGHFGTFIIQSPGTDDSGTVRYLLVGSFNYKQYA